MFQVLAAWFCACSLLLWANQNATPCSFCLSKDNFAPEPVFMATWSSPSFPAHKSPCCWLASVLEPRATVALWMFTLQTPALWLLHMHPTPKTLELELLQTRSHQCSRTQLCGCFISSHASDTNTTTIHKVDSASREVLLAMTSLMREKEISWSPAVFTTEDSNIPYYCYRHLQPSPALTTADTPAQKLCHWAFQRSETITPYHQCSALTHRSVLCLEEVTAPSNVQTSSKASRNMKNHGNTTTHFNAQQFSNNWPQRNAILWINWQRIQNDYFKGSLASYKRT